MVRKLEVMHNPRVILMYYQPYYYAQNAMGNPQFQDSFFIDVIKYGIKL